MDHLCMNDVWAASANDRQQSTQPPRVRHSTGHLEREDADSRPIEDRFRSIRRDHRRDVDVPTPSAEFAAEQPNLLLGPAQIERRHQVPDAGLGIELHRSILAAAGTLTRLSAVWRPPAMEPAPACVSI